MSHPKKFSVTNLNAAKRKVFGSDTNEFFWAILQTVICFDSKAYASYLCQ